MTVIGQNIGGKNLDEAVRLDIRIKRGDTLSFTYDVYYLDSEGVEQAYDFTGATIKAHIKARATDLKPLRILQISATDNVLTFFLDEKALKLDANRYVYDVEIEDSDGIHQTILYGDFVITQDVTYWNQSTEEKVEVKLFAKILASILPSFRAGLYIFTTSVTNTVYEIIKNIVHFGLATTVSLLKCPSQRVYTLFNTRISGTLSKSFEYTATMQTKVDYNVYLSG